MGNLAITQFKRPHRMQHHNRAFARPLAESLDTLDHNGTAVTADQQQRQLDGLPFFRKRME